MIPAHMWPRLLWHWQWGKPILMHHLWTFGGALHWILNRVAVVTCPFLEPIPAPMLISELNRDQISLMGDIICGQININMWTTSVKGKLEKIMFYFFFYIYLVGRRCRGEVWCTWVGSCHIQLFIHFTGRKGLNTSKYVSRKSRKYGKSCDAEQRFFCGSQPSGVESINPGANIVWACGALITLLHPLLHPSQILIRATQTKGAATNPVTTHDF